MVLYAATTNPGKLREFADSASADAIEVLPLPGLKQMPEPVEDAATFLGNAELKALAYSRLAPGMTVFADDSGLEVDALGGRPGVISARFADAMGWDGPGTKDERNNACLLSMLHALPAPDNAANWPDEPAAGRESNRRARFVCALALARDGEILLRAEGSVEGEILDSPRGANGFGYDPLFLIPALGRTTAELPSEEKWQVSHRGRAFRDLLHQLP